MTIHPPTWWVADIVKDVQNIYQDLDKIGKWVADIVNDIQNLYQVPELLNLWPQQKQEGQPLPLPAPVAHEAPRSCAVPALRDVTISSEMQASFVTQVRHAVAEATAPLPPAASPTSLPDVTEKCLDIREPTGFQAR